MREGSPTLLVLRKELKLLAPRRLVVEGSAAAVIEVSLEVWMKVVEVFREEEAARPD